MKFLIRYAYARYAYAETMPINLVIPKIWLFTIADALLSKMSIGKMNALCNYLLIWVILKGAKLIFAC